MNIIPAILILIFFFAPKTFAMAQQPTCSMQLLCDQMKEMNAVDQIVSFKHQHSPQEIDSIFVENQIAILELLKSKRSLLPESVFSKMVKKITAVTLADFHSAPIKRILSGACLRPNAVYIPSLNQIVVCPTLLKFPKETLRQILAHELGHVIQDLQQYLTCFDEYPKAQAEEIFADWVASKVISEKLARESNHKISGQWAFESQLIFLHLACPAPEKGKKDWAPSHLNFQKRIEKVFLSQPSFQIALQCQPVEAGLCD